ncbi:hypothetical protein H7Y40_00815 [Pedobacter sp.]|nr:hypothetical protein [Candidatus Saccharibacteria bacterium]
MQLLTSDGQKVLIAQLQERIATLPDAAKHTDVLTIFDMLARSEEIAIPKEELKLSIAAGEEPFFILFHAGSSYDSGAAFAFQIELWDKYWILRAGLKDNNGQDFLITFNQLTMRYRDYTDGSLPKLADSIFATLRYALSGQIMLLACQNAEKNAYSSELAIQTSSGYRAVDTMWFGEKIVAQPTEAVALTNNLLPTRGAIDGNYVFAAQKDGKPILKGRTFEGSQFTALSYEDYKKYAHAQSGGSRRTLIFLTASLFAVYLSVLIAKYFFPDAGAYFFGLIVAALAVILGIMAKKFPQIVVIGLVPGISGFAALGAFVGVGALLSNISLIDTAINDSGTALSMTIVLGWFAAGLALGIVTFMKVEKRLVQYYKDK